MNKITLAAGAAALALAGTVAGVAIAQQHRPHHRMMQDPFGDATVTRAEAQAKAAEMFARLDANKDGKLNQADRAARISAQIAERFDAIDTNKDGKIDKAEFAAAHQPGKGGPGMMGHGGMDRMGMNRMGMAGPMLGRMDGNGDKAISREEFIAGALKRFDAADADKDGKLTPEERRGAMRARIGGMKGMSPPPAPATGPARTN